MSLEMRHPMIDVRALLYDKNDAPLISQYLLHEIFTYVRIGFLVLLETTPPFLHLLCFFINGRCSKCSLMRTEGSA